MALEVNIEKRFEKFLLKVSFTTGDGITGLLGARAGQSMTLKCVRELSPRTPAASSGCRTL